MGWFPMKQVPHPPPNLPLDGGGVSNVGAYARMRGAKPLLHKNPGFRRPDYS